MAGVFDKDPVKSWTLPGHYYYDAEIYRRELERIFYHSWLYVCHVSRLREPGRYQVRDIGDQSVGSAVALSDALEELREELDIGMSEDADEDEEEDGEFEGEPGHELEMVDQQLSAAWHAFARAVSACVSRQVPVQVIS